MFFVPKAPEGSDAKMYMFLFLATFGCTVGFQGWTLLYTNFAVQAAELSATENGIIQSVREIPGLLGFTLIPLLLFMREDRLMVYAVIATGLGTFLTGFFPAFTPILFTTLLMSFGFHYFESISQSLMLQYFDLSQAPLIMGKMRGLAASGSLLASVFVFVFSENLPFTWLFSIVGVIGMGFGITCLFINPSNPSLPVQRKKLVLRSRYWLFYILTFLMGARRIIFTVFALFLLVEKFDFSVRTISVLFMFNYLANWFLNPFIGKCINWFGERALLTTEYITALVVFFGYAYTENAVVVSLLYVIDCLVFNFSFAVRTFFQKIAYKEDIAPSMAVAQTINHLSAVIVPALGGWMWMTWSYKWPFYGGMALTAISLILVQYITKEIKKYQV